MSGYLFDSETGRDVTVSAWEWDDNGRITHWKLSCVDTAWQEVVTAAEFRDRCREEAASLIPREQGDADEP